jgi:sialate O-acetylesterase
MRALMVNPSAESYNAAEPCETFEGYTAKWEITTPEAARHYSRVAFYFAEALQRQHNVPIGLIVSSFDGSSIEAWMPRETLASLPEYNIAGTFRPAWNLSWGGGQTPFIRFNAHIAPLAPFALRGVLWYQGESNANPPTSIRYRDLLALMIRDWRRLWGNDALPFIAIQLHSFGKLDTARPPLPNDVRRGSKWRNRNSPSRVKCLTSRAP